MPYSVVKKGDRFIIINKDTGKTVGSSRTRKKAEASVRARNASHYGWKPKR